VDSDNENILRPLEHDGLVATPSVSATTSAHTEQLPRDCETLLRKDLSDANKLEILLYFSSFNPPSSYQFPTKVEFGKNRSFQHKYLQLYSWLGYTCKLDGCLCLPCCLFGSDSSMGKKFVEKPYSNWTALNQKLKLHSTCPTHVRCSLAMKSFKDAHTGTQPTIDTAMSKNRQEQFDLNCKRLDAIIDCIVLCGKQNIALRGHRDANNQAQTSNPGNFKAILEFRALGDEILQKHLTNGPKNAQYTCPETQNEIISICKHLIWEKLSRQVAESGFFSVICDECTDSSNKEQLSLSVRYVANDQVCESFVGFFELNEGVTGRAIATTIENALADCHLDPSQMRGQAYDGASNMSGKYKGCAAIIQQKYPLAMYSHCCSHILNLAVVQACSLVQVQNMLGVIDKVFKFFDNHPKRQYLLNTSCAADGLATSKLKSLCKTRWVQRIDALQLFVSMFVSIIKSFDQVTTNSSDWSRDSITDAMSLCKAMLNFEFIITLITVERCMSFTHNLTTSLQAKAIDILKATQHVGVLRKVLTDFRSNIDVQFNTLFKNASRLAEKYEVSIKTPRTCSRQTARDNHPAENAEEYYRRSLAITFLDHLVTEIDSRFSSHSIKAIRCLGIIPSCFSSDHKATDDEILEFFGSDIDSCSVAKAELDIWRSYFEGKTALPTTPKACLEHASPLLFPHIRKFLIRMMVIPVTSCEAERSFSALRRIKTYLRSTMSQERLTGLALLTIHQHSSLVPSTSEIREEFLRKNRRLMEQKLI